MSRILITGVLGFIGSHCARICLKRGHSVVGLNRDRNQQSKMRIRDFEHNERFSLVYTDLNDDISGILEDIDIVINFAAKTFVDHSIKDPAPFIKSNLLGTYNLLEQARKYKIKKFIQISTDEVYGSIAKGYFREDDPLNPTNPYSAAKAGAEMFVISYVHSYGLPAIIVRSENNYGAFQDKQKAMPTFIRKALANKKLPVYGDGRHRRMWIRVEDNCDAILFLMEKGEAGQIYNIGGKQEKENIEVAKTILKILGKPENLIEFIPDYDIRPGHDRRYAMDISKLFALGWHPQYTFETGIEEVVNWYRNNEWWLK